MWAEIYKHTYRFGRPSPEGCRKQTAAGSSVDSPSHKANAILFGLKLVSRRRPLFSVPLYHPRSAFFGKPENGTYL